MSDDPYLDGIMKRVPERSEQSQTLPTSNDLLTKLRWIGSIAAFKEPDIARACADAAGEIERLTRELETSRSIARGTAEHHQDACLTCDRLRAAANGVAGWLLHRFGPNTPEAREAETLLAAARSAPETSGSQCDCWERISALIVNGTLPGDGTDLTAERNGVILAANTIARDRPAFISSAPKAGGDPA